MADVLHDGDSEDAGEASPSSSSPPSSTPPAAPSGTQPAESPKVEVAPGVATAQPPAQPPVPPADPSAPKPGEAPSSGVTQPPATATPPEDPNAWRGPAVEALSNEYTQLLPADVGDQILADPKVAHQVLGKLAAQLHLRVLESAVTGLASTLPRYLHSYHQQAESHRQAREAFVKRWPQLADAKHEQAIAMAAQAFRLQNPKATTEQAIEFVGAQLMLQMNLAAGQSGQPPVQPTLPVGSPDRPSVGATQGPAAPAPSAQNHINEVFVDEVD